MCSDGEDWSQKDEDCALNNLSLTLVTDGQRLQLLELLTEPINFFILFYLPSRNQVWRDEETDPGHEHKQSAGDVIVENKLEASSL